MNTETLEHHMWIHNNVLLKYIKIFYSSSSFCLCANEYMNQLFQNSCQMSAKNNFRSSQNNAASVSWSGIFLRETTKSKSLFQAKRHILLGEKKKFYLFVTVFKSFWCCSHCYSFILTSLKRNCQNIQVFLIWKTFFI